MEQIHKEVHGGDPDLSFTSWAQVEEEYENIEWDQDLFDKFLLTAKKYVDGGLERISESYFQIKQPKNPTTEWLVGELEKNTYDEDIPDEKEPDGFQYDVIQRDGTDIVQASYVYTDVKTDISATGKVRSRVSETAIDFRILPSQSLIIVESTYPPDVQKMKGVFGKTDLAAVVCGDLTSNYDEANERVEAFRRSFPEAEINE